MKISFYNTMGRKLEEFKPLHKEEVGYYSCGPTVYNFAHIGNFRAYMFADLLKRTLKYYGYKVKHVMNLTDIDDKTIRDSRAEGIPLDQFTKRYKDAFFEDVDTVRIQRADYYPAATDCIQDMIEMIKALEEKGFAYKASDNCVYFSITKFPEYGKLAKIDMENQRAGVRIKTDEYAKDSVADFALWKAWDEEDGDVYWDSPWGKGRPGWHIECSAMSKKHLGETFDIHTGGVDNMFPHHEDEIAQSESANGRKFVNFWLHNAHLMVEGEKMSKSAGNFYTLKDILNKGYEGREIRWVLLSTHYRKKLNFTFEACDKAKETLKKFRELFKRLRAVSGEDKDHNIFSIVEEAKSKFKTALGEDLNVSEALAAIYGLQTNLNKMLEADTLGQNGAEAALDQFRDFDLVFAAFDVDEAEQTIPAEVTELAEARLKARADKDWGKSDELRDQLKEMGWVIEDAKGGYNLKPL